MPFTSGIRSRDANDGESWEERLPMRTFDQGIPSLSAIAGWDRLDTAALVAGLSTIEKYQANGIRLDWLLRLVLAYAKGSEPSSLPAICAAFNEGMDAAGITVMEDPPEDAFIDQVWIGNQDFHLFTGNWTTVGPFTQTLIDAYSSLTDSPALNKALRESVELLKLSSALVERTGTPIEGGPASPRDRMDLSDEAFASDLRARVMFTAQELADAGIAPALLAPFTLHQNDFALIAQRPVGDSPLEFRPLFIDAARTVVVNPVGLSLAARAHLIAAAKSARRDAPLLKALARVQEDYSCATNFWPNRLLGLRDLGKHFLRLAIIEYEKGHFLQVIQIVCPLRYFPQHAFGRAIPHQSETMREATSAVRGLWAQLRQVRDVRSSTTVYLISNWGGRFEISFNHQGAPAHWAFFVLGFSEASVIGACKDGRFRDIRRIVLQQRRLEAAGYEFDNRSGILNTFGYWHLTTGNFFSDVTLNLTPPAMVAIPSDCLILPRQEAKEKQDPRALSWVSGDAIRVQRVWDSEREQKPIYASVADMDAGRLRSALVVAGRAWWVEILEPHRDLWKLRLMTMMVEWLNAIASKVIEREPSLFPPAVSVARIEVLATPEVETDEPEDLPSFKIEDTVRISVDPDGQKRVVILKSWPRALQAPTNAAEAYLAAHVLAALSSASEDAIAPYRTLVEESIGSTDWRHMHGKAPVFPAERLAAYGEVAPFREVRPSAFALAKCGMAWNLRPPSTAQRLEGEAECKTLLLGLHEQLLGNLITQIRRFDRARLALALASRYQSARVEGVRWRIAIRALRAINGEEANADAFKQEIAINAVSRATKALLEITACEAPAEQGLEPMRTDIDELLASCLVFLSNSYLYPAIRAGMIPAKLLISPQGELLADRSLFESTLKRPAQTISLAQFDEAARRYTPGEEAETLGTPDTEEEIKRELESIIPAEYGAPLDVFTTLHTAAVDIFAGSRAGLGIMRRSELAQKLDDPDGFRATDFAPVFSRMTLGRRSSWGEQPQSRGSINIDLGRFDRPYSLINRPLLALDDDSADPLVLVSPLLICDSLQHSLMGLMEGTLQNQYWDSAAAKSFVGRRAKLRGEQFEGAVAARLRSTGLQAETRMTLSKLLQKKVPKELGDIDVLAVSKSGKTLWVLETKNLKTCRTESEVCARLDEYRGRHISKEGRADQPDKMLRHLRRVAYLREYLSCVVTPWGDHHIERVVGMLIVDTPQPFNFFSHEALLDGTSIYVNQIATFDFEALPQAAGNGEPSG